MHNSVRKTFPLAIALLLALCGAAVAGDNANVVISLDEEHAAADAGEQVQVPLSAAGMVGVKQFEVTLTVLPADAFDLAATTFTPAFGFSPGVELLGDGQVKSGGATLGEAVDGDGDLGVFTLTMSSSFSRGSPAEIVVSSVSLGASSVDRDVLGPEGLFIVNWAVPPPDMMPTSPLSLNPAYSSVGTGADADGSPGEIELSVNFTDDGAPAKGQTIAWDITNTGSRSVYLLGVGEVPSGVYVCLRNVTDEAGNAAVQFDAEGNLKAAATSLDVRARTTAVNPAGDTIDLAVDFNATWAVPDPDKLMFVSQVSLNNDDKALNEVVAGPGAKIPVVLSANELVGVKQVEVIVTVSPADAFDLEKTTFSGSSAFRLAGPGVEVSGNQVRGGAVVLSDAVDGDAHIGSFVLVTSDNFTEEVEAEIVVHSVSLGPSSGMRDYLDAELLSRSMHLNRPDPVLVATAPLVGNSLVSGADTGVVDDDSPGEIAYSVNFTNLWGDPGEDQLILWDVYNRSTEWVSVLGIGTIPPHGSAFVRNTTDADGNSSIEVDAEVVSFLSITASTATENAAGKALDLAIDFSAAWAAAKPLAALPLANSLSQNYPNPFNPETTIPYELSSDAIVSLTIYNIAGQVVRRLVDGEALAAGQYQAVWDGRSESGAGVASGMYFYLLHAGDYVAKRKMVLLR